MKSCSPAMIVAWAALPGETVEMETANAPTAQQERIKACNRQAVETTGEEGASFMSACLKG